MQCFVPTLRKTIFFLALSSHGLIWQDGFGDLCKKLCIKDPSSRNDALNNTVSCRSSEAAADAHTVPLLSDPQNSDKLDAAMESKKRDQLGASLSVLQRKQEELVYFFFL